MKVDEVMGEGLLDKVRAALGSVKGAIVSSVETLVQKFKRNSSAKLTSIGEFDVVELNLKAVPTRVDTGAATSSIHATDVKVDDGKVSFVTSDGRAHTLPFLKMSTIKNANGIREVPSVKLTLKWRGKPYTGITVKLADRSKLKYKLLVGRNLIKELKLPVHIDPSDDLSGDDDGGKKP